MSLHDIVTNIDDTVEEPVTVPEWTHPQTGEPLTFLVRSMTGTTRAKMIQSSRTAEGETDFTRMYPAMVVATACDPEGGELVFTEADYDMLASKHAGALERLGEAALRVSGLSRNADETLGKDSSSIPSDDSGSDSPESSDAASPTPSSA